VTDRETDPVSLFVRAEGDGGMNGWLLVRGAGIVVGIATLLRVATNEGMVTYDPLFQAWVDWLSDIVELGFLTKFIGPLLHWGIDQVRSAGISVPDLQDDWRPAFVFSMLMFAANFRNVGIWWLLIATLFGALAIATWSGLTGSLWPVTITIAISASTATLIAGEALSAVATRSAATAIEVVALGFAVAVGVFADISPAVTLLASALLFLLSGIVESWPGKWWSMLANASFNTGIDMLGVMLGALGLALIFANPPI
jgi:hypothetical protein